MIYTPYFRIYRPFSENVNIDNPLLYYAEDERYCKERKQLIRMYKMLQAQVIDTFQYVEPVEANKSVYSLRYHQLYLNICAEIETNFRGILKANGYGRGNEKSWNIKDDFFKTNSALKLHGYKLESFFYEISNCSGANQPFERWSNSYELTWYQDHNSVKHNRTTDYHNASLLNVVTALAGLYILLYSQFGILVDTITSYGIMTLVISGNSFLTLETNNMGYNFIQKPTWGEQEKYGFEWDTIKTNDSPFQKFAF